MKTQDQIRTELTRLRARLRAQLGQTLEVEILQSVIEGKLGAKIIDSVDSIVGTYSLEELVIAVEINAEISACESPEDAGRH